MILFLLKSLCMIATKSTNISNSVSYLDRNPTPNPGDPIPNFKVVFLKTGSRFQHYFIVLNILDYKQHIHLIYLKFFFFLKGTSTLQSMVS